MKNNLFTLIFAFVLLFCFPGVIVQAIDNQLVTELKVFEKDTTYRYLYLYDGQGNKVLETKYKQENAEWIRVSLNEWVYEGSDCVIQREKIWKNDAWEVLYIINYEYNNGLKSSEIHNLYSNKVAFPLRKISFFYNQSELTSRKEYDWRNGAWILIKNNDFTYFPDGKLESDTTDVYQSEIISKQLLSTFSYNLNGTLSAQLLKQKVNNIGWVNSELFNWYYKPGSGQIFSQRNKKWISDISTWENVQRADYEYNENNKLLSETYQHWERMFWKNDLRYDYEYGADKNLQNKILLFPIYNQWRSSISIHYLNYADNKANLLESLYEFWGGNKGELVDSYIPFLFNNDISIKKAKRIQLNYLPVNPTGISTIENKNKLNFITIYPNPSEGMFYFDIQEYKVLSWSISDLNGQIMKSQVQPIRSGVIDLTDLPKGIYLLNATTGDAQLYQKLIKE